MTDATFSELIARAKAGDEDAVHTLLHDFEPEVRIAIRRWLPRALRPQFDSMDFVQNVWTSVFAKGEVEPDRFENRQHLLGFLMGVARNKVHEEYRRRTRTHKYNLNKEEPLYVRRGNREEPREVPTTDPTPSQAVQEHDRFDQMISGRKQRDIEILNLKRAGLTLEEIAEQTGLNERTVRRVIDAVRQRMEERQWC